MKLYVLSTGYSMYPEDIATRGIFTSLEALRQAILDAAAEQRAQYENRKSREFIECEYEAWNDDEKLCDHDCEGCDWQNSREAFEKAQSNMESQGFIPNENIIVEEWEANQVIDRDCTGTLHDQIRKTYVLWSYETFTGYPTVAELYGDEICPL